MAARSPTCNKSTLVVFIVYTYKNMDKLSVFCYPPDSSSSSSTRWKRADGGGATGTRTLQQRV